MIPLELVWLAFIGACLVVVGMLLRWSNRAERRRNDEMRRHVWRTY